MKYFVYQDAVFAYAFKLQFKKLLCEGNSFFDALKMMKFNEEKLLQFELKLKRGDINFPVKFQENAPIAHYIKEYRYILENDKIIFNIFKKTDKNYYILNPEFLKTIKNLDDIILLINHFCRSHPEGLKYPIKNNKIEFKIKNREF